MCIYIYIYIYSNKQYKLSVASFWIPADGIIITIISIIIDNNGNNNIRYIYVTSSYAIHHSSTYIGAPPGPRRGSRRHPRRVASETLMVWYGMLCCKTVTYYTIIYYNISYYYILYLTIIYDMLCHVM